MYNEQPYTPPFTGTIADLIARPAEARAAAIRAAAQAQGHAAEVSGQAWGQAATNIGNTVAAIPQQIQQQKDQALRRQMGAIELEAAKLKLGEEKKTLTENDVFKGILKDTPQIDEDGIALYDIPTISQKATAAGLDPSTYVSHLDGINTSFRQERAAKMALVQRGAQGIIAAGNDPDLANHFLDQLDANHTFPKDEIAKYRAFIQADPKNVATLTAYLAGPQKMENATPGSMARNPLTGQVVPGSAVPDEPEVVGPGASLVNPQTGASVYTAPPTTSLQSENVIYQGKPVQVTFDPRTGKRTMTDAQTGQTVDVTGKTTPIPTAAQVSINAGTLSDAALEQAARAYLTRGKEALPAGNGAAGVMQRTAIMNRAAELDPTAALALNQAVYKADAANLTNLQKTEGTLSAFENTAGKNLDQFLTLASKIPDTGVPWLNTPVRLLNEKVVGSANMAAINAARDVALREIARVTNDPKLSGALTDSARQEVAALSPKDATLPQIRAVVKVLKQDMANVHSGLTQQIDAVKSGIGANPNAPAAAAPAMIEAKDAQGTIHHAPAGTPLPAGWTLVK